MLLWSGSVIPVILTSPGGARKNIIGESGLQDLVQGAFVKMNTSVGARIGIANLFLRMAQVAVEAE
jgi:hypothetical protein